MAGIPLQPFSAPIHPNKPPRSAAPWILPLFVLCLAYGLLGLTLTQPLLHAEMMQRCVLMDPSRARIWSVGNIEIGVAYLCVFGGMAYYFVRIYATNKRHLLDLGLALAYLCGSFTLDYLCVQTLEPFLALLVGDAVVITFTALVSRQVWFQRLLGVFVPIIFLSCGIGHFLEGLSYWHLTYPINTPWTMVTSDVGFAVLLNASRFPAFLRGEEVVEELAVSRARAEVLQAQIEAREQAEAASRVSEARFRTLYETMLQGVVFYGRDGRAAEANPAAQRILGLSLEELQSGSVSTHWHAIREDGTELPSDAHPVTSAFRTGQPVESVVLGLPHPEHAGTRWLRIDAIPEFKAGESEPFQVYSIFEDITGPKQAENALRQLNSELDQRVQDRTAQLAEANVELEAFSYSVSHDLRAPLRSIDGFSQALLEDYSSNLDDRGRNYLQRVRAASQRMATLIEDLLSLARVTRLEMERVQVDLSAMVTEVCSVLAKAHPERTVEVSIAAGLRTRADPRLLRIVLENLLGNAWKYTSYQDQPQIEFGRAEHSGKECFFVRDNGAGFDMAYVGKLFSPFQRLHTTTEFSGTGIGLATVLRIVRRHGGWIQAEGAVGQGAAFYFTLQG